MTDGTRLAQLGWDAAWATKLADLGDEALLPARVVGQRKGSYRLWDAAGELIGVPSGRLRRAAADGELFPAVGDWVAMTGSGEGEAVIRAVLPRTGKFSRQAASGSDRRSGGRTAEQVVAANVDTAFIVAGLDGGRNLSPRRIERYLTVVWTGGATPVVVLNKMDACDDVAEAIRRVEPVAGGAPIHPVSATERLGLDALRGYLGSGRTAVFLGSSGVGKSSLINALMGEATMKTGGVREDDLRGRHTTSHRELLLLPEGGAVIDTPGMRELQMWAEVDEDALEVSFEDIEQLADQCRFVNCAHRTEPDCAILAAIASGEMDEKRLLDYRKLEKELAHQARRQNLLAELQEKAQGKRMAKMQKEAQRRRGGGKS